MNGKNKKRITVSILAIIGFAVLMFFNQYQADTVNAANTSSSDSGVLLDKIYQKINQSGFTEDTLASLKKVEDQIYKKGAGNSLNDVQWCYYAYVYNLIYLNKQKEVGPIMNRWSKALESVYQSEQDVTYDFAFDLKLKSERFFDAGMLLGTEYDPLLLSYAQNLADFFEERTEADPDLPKFYLQLGLESLSYALLYNQKFEDYGKTVSKMLSIEDQATGIIPEDILPQAAYMYLLKGNFERCLEILKNVITVLGDTKDPIDQRTGTNEVIDDLYQMKKRNIESKNIDKILQELPEPILNITGVTANGPADISGVYKGDQINKYQGVKCLSYDHFTDLVAAHAGDPKIELEIIRDNETMVITVPAGRLGISIAEDIKK